MTVGECVMANYLGAHAGSGMNGISEKGDVLA
jgi:hypothetical protein